MTSLIVYDIIRFERDNKLYLTNGYFQKHVACSSRYFADANFVQLIGLKSNYFVPLSSISENISNKYKLLNLKKYIRQKLNYTLLRQTLRHWAYRPNGAIFNSAFKRFSNNIDR